MPCCFDGCKVKEVNSKLQISRKENLKKCTFRETFILVLSSSAVFCLQDCVSDFFKICFACDMKGFYGSSLENEIDFANIRNPSQISWLKIKLSKH